MEKARAECSPCRATGLYRGFAEPAGVAVVCLACGGSGARDVEPGRETYRPFAGRRDRDDVRYVRRSRGAFVLSCGPVGQAISYADFRAGKLP